MDLGLSGRVALVTGGGQGVGRRICLELAMEGACIAVNDLVPQRAAAVAAEITQAGGQALAAPADITVASAVDQMVGLVADQWGKPVTVLVNNAGVIPERRAQGGMPPPFLQTPPADWGKIINLNIYGSMHCCHAVLPGMVRETSGRIINIISEAGRIGEANLAVYSGAKAALVGFGKAIAREHARHGITVNAVALGAVSHEGITSGPLSPDATPENDAALSRMLSAYPISKSVGRLARPEDISGLVTFLASQRALFITGQVVGASGGYAMP